MTTELSTLLSAAEEALEHMVVNTRHWRNLRDAIRAVRDKERGFTEEQHFEHLTQSAGLNEEEL